MDATRALLASGTLLLAVAALLGFVQERYRDQPSLFAGWRVVHARATAGAVQLLALSADWGTLIEPGACSHPLASTLIAVAWAFFLGPLSRVLEWPRVARAVNISGALLAVPGYLALPFTLF